MAGFRNKERDFLGKVLLALVSAALAVVMAEAGVRFLVFLKFKSGPLVTMRVGSNLPGFPNRYTAYGGIRTHYSRDFGFDHVTDTDIYGIRVEDGAPALFYKKHYNALGTVGPLKPGYDDPELKILVFGDSFTAMQDGDTLWPKLLEDQLTERLGRDVNVLNFGRDGYGILQMFDLASSKVPEFQPDLVLVAFISDDLRRSRVWRTHQVTESETRLFYSTDPSNPAKRARSVAAELIHPGITREWCNTVAKNPGAGDPLLQELRQQFVRIRKDYVLPLDYGTMSRSYILDRLFHRDFFYSMTKKVRPDFRIAFDDLADDPQFLDTVAALKKTGIPTHLVHLPTHPELTKGTHLLSRQQRALLASLERHTRQKPLDLLPFRHHIEQNFEDLFLLPYDHHPSAAGLEFYAEVVADFVIERMAS